MLQIVSQNKTELEKVLFLHKECVRRLLMVIFFLVQKRGEKKKQLKYPKIDTLVK